MVEDIRGSNSNKGLPSCSICGRNLGPVRDAAHLSRLTCDACKRTQEEPIPEELPVIGKKPASDIAHLESSRLAPDPKLVSPAQPTSSERQGSEEIKEDSQGVVGSGSSRAALAVGNPEKIAESPGEVIPDLVEMLQQLDTDIASMISDTSASLAASSEAESSTADPTELAESLREDLRQIRSDSRSLNAELRTAQEALKGRLEEIGGLQASLVAQRAATTRKQKALTKAEGLVADLDDKRRELNRKLRQARKESREWQAKYEAAERRDVGMKRQVTRLQNQLSSAARLKEIAEWLSAGLSFVTELFDTKIATMGSGPYEVDELDVHLEDRGFDLHWPGPGCHDVGVIVVGREGWVEEALEGHIAAREGEKLRIYSQEMFLASLAVGRDALEDWPEEELYAWADGHPALEFLRTSDIQWPNVFPERLPDQFDPFEFVVSDVDESPLKKMGYTVGLTHGLPAKQRKSILRQAFKNELPWTHSDEYMEDWGHPASRRRLWRMAHHLAWLANTWKRMASHRFAVSDWANDLDHLEQEFFRPWMSFKWPSVNVPR